MSTVINTNIAAIRTHNVYNKNNEYMNQALTKVSTGQKINSAKDGASTWAITEKMRERIRVNDQANQNVQNDTALLKTAEGGLSNTIDILKTLKERAVNAANDSNITTDRNIIQAEVEQLLAQIDDNAQKVKFNGRVLLDGQAGLDESGTAAGNNFTAATARTPSTGTGTGGATGTGSTTTTTPTTNTTDKYIFSEAITLTQDAVVSDTTLNSNITTYLTDNGITPTAGASATTINLSDIGAYSNTTTGATEPTLATGTLYYTASGWAASQGGTIYTATTNPNYSAGGGSGGGSTGSGNGLTFHIGGEAGFTMSVNLSDMTTTGLSITGIDLTTQANAKSAITTIDNALNLALKEQTKIGAYESRLGYASDNLVTMNENLEAANSTMRDSDIAKEMTQYMKYSVLAQASQYMLAQAGQNAYSVLNLLQQ